MRREAFHSAIERDAAGLVAAARTGDLGATVPSCPDWSLADLCRHVGDVFWHRVQVVRERLDSPMVSSKPDRGPVEGAPDYLETQAHDLLTTLRAAKATDQVWTWFPTDTTVGFWDRRMAQEVAVHRWDGETTALATADPIEPALAADGIDEFLTVFLPLEETVLTGGGERVHLHATDADADWVIRITPDGVVPERGHEKGEAGLRGRASDLLLILWRRLEPDTAEVFGDRVVLERFLGWMDLT